MPANYLTRLEPRARSAGLEEGVAAKIHDAAWMLARQWQVGELRGEDAGSPTGIELHAESARLSQWRSFGAARWRGYDPDALPIEALVEAQPLRAPAWTARMRIDAGREFLQLLREAGLADYLPEFLDEYGIDAPPPGLKVVDEAGARLLAVAAGRVPDGEALFRALTTAMRQGQLPAAPAIDVGDTVVFTNMARDWLATLAAGLEESDGSTWDPARLEYGFSVATGADADATQLDAHEYRGGRLDWHSFDTLAVAAPSGFTALPPINVLPTGIRFRGMPTARWWEFEDAAMDMGAIDAGPSDVARMALLEFALLYGNDFFAVPLQLPVGTLTRIKSLMVADTFGMRLGIEPASRGTQRVGAGRWSMFTLTQTQRGGSAVPADVFFLPPVVGPSIASELVEDVLLLRDEMANLAWAIEKSCEGQDGIARERAEANIRAMAQGRSPPDNPALKYRLGTSVPANWFPLVPTRGQELMLELRRMADQLQNPQAVPAGTFLTLPATALHEEEVPREGARLSRDYVMARWMNGGSLVWSRRRKRVGRGEGSSGLRFDVVEIEPAPSD